MRAEHGHPPHTFHPAATRGSIDERRADPPRPAPRVQTRGRSKTQETGGRHASAKQCRARACRPFPAEARCTSRYENHGQRNTRERVEGHAKGMHPRSPATRPRPRLPNTAKAPGEVGPTGPKGGKGEGRGHMHHRGEWDGRGEPKDTTTTRPDDHTSRRGERSLSSRRKRPERSVSVTVVRTAGERR
jgi:hypothetical protein